MHRNDAEFRALVKSGKHTRKFTNDIAVENKEGLRSCAQIFLCQGQGARRAQRFLLDGKGDLDIVLLLDLEDSVNNMPGMKKTFFMALSMTSG